MRKLIALSALAVCLGATSTAQAKLTPERIAYWKRIHLCEQPASWHGGYPKYPGGLGMSVGAWNWWAGELGLLKQYPTGAHAPMLVQIRVADYGWRAHRGLWTSMPRCGYPPS